MDNPKPKRKPRVKRKPKTPTQRQSQRQANVQTVKINIGDLTKTKPKRKPRAKKQDREKDGQSSFNYGGGGISISVPSYSQQMRPFSYSPPVFSRASEPVKAVPSVPVPAEELPVASDGRPPPRKISELTSYRVPRDMTPFSGAISAGFISSEAPALTRGIYEPMTEEDIIQRDMRRFEKMNEEELQREMRRYESAGSETSRATQKMMELGDVIISKTMQDIGNAPSAASGGSIQEAIEKGLASSPTPVQSPQTSIGGGGRVYKTTPEQRAKARERYAKRRDQTLAMESQLGEFNRPSLKKEGRSGYGSNQ